MTTSISSLPAPGPGSYARSDAAAHPPARGARPWPTAMALALALVCWALAQLLASTPTMAQAGPSQAAQPRASAQPLLILALGDSLTAGYQLPAAQSFPAQLEARLRRDGHAVRVVNAGVSGDTTAQARARLQWVLRGLGRNPDIAIVALGANDMLRGQPVPQAEANLDHIVGELRRRGTTVVVAGMLAAPNLGPAYGRAYNGMFPAVARRHNALLYPFFLEGVAAQPAMLLADGMHPNARGVARMVEGIRPTVLRAIERHRAQR